MRFLQPAAPERALSWAQQERPYGGHAREQYRAGIELLKEAQKQHDASYTRAVGQDRLATLLTLLTFVLAAAAGITILPESINRYVSAGIAFSATVTSGIMTGYDPVRRAREARGQMAEWLKYRDQVRRLLRQARGSADNERARQRLEDELGHLQDQRNDHLVA